MTRQNVTDGVREIMSKTCPTCHGEGVVKSEETIAIETARHLRAMVRDRDAEAFLVRLNPKVTAWFVADGARELHALEEETGRWFHFEGSEGLPLDHFAIVADGSREEIEERAVPFRAGEEVHVDLVEPHMYNPDDAVAKVDGYLIDVVNGIPFVGEKKLVRIEEAGRTIARAVLVGADAERAEEAARERAAAPPRLPLEDRDALVSVRNVDASHGERQVLFDINLLVRPRECLALVGESGSGKTTLARCIAGLHRRFTGEIALHGKPLPAGSRARDRQTRREIQYVFQSPYSSLNPRKTIAQIIGQPLRLFFDATGEAAHRRVVDVLDRVALSSSVTDRYPHQLSGGERQRVAIARALVAEPSLLVCDEVTSALDVSVQAAIVDLLGELQREMELGLLFVTHNLALIRTIAQEVAVMSEGRIVEYGKVDAVLDAPRAGYTQKLLSDTPSLEQALAAAV
jgi:ABC-type dipeptide/oligopeptide/nickel transport system ATPase subunit